MFVILDKYLNITDIESIINSVVNKSMKQEKNIEIISQTQNIDYEQVASVLELLKDGSTVPFIARYRKEVTGGLDEVQVVAIENNAKQLKELDTRREYILTAIEKQGKLTEELKQKIILAKDITLLEDIYLPFKQKKLSRAVQAKNRGLEPLAMLLFSQEAADVDAEAEKYINISSKKEESVPNIEAALQGARDFIAEIINEDSGVRKIARLVYENGAKIHSEVKKSKKKEAEKFQDYFDYVEYLADCPSHRLLAMRRGEHEGFLRVSIKPDVQALTHEVSRLIIKNSYETTEQVKIALIDSVERLLMPSLETEFAKASKLKADIEAIEVFSMNLKQLLLEAPLGGKRVLAIDPGFRTGCKTVCLDEQGNLLFNTVIYPDRSAADAAKIVNALIDKFAMQVIAIGDGTASRETDAFIKSLQISIPVFMVSEAGASIYSASEVAREEFPELDLTVRGAISIGRRLLDPLAELVKLDPKSIGVGQYQHDVDQKLLKSSLDTTVISCVNSVGVNLNTASKHILTYISGLGPALATNIVEYRAQNGLFTSRKQLTKVKKLGNKAYEQCAGFLRVANKKQPLDNSAVHPESYKVVEQMAKDLDMAVSELIGNESAVNKIELYKYITDKIGMPTLEDIIQELKKPGVDPRGQAEVFEFSQEVKDIKDLELGMELPGIVTNVTNFGAFVDLGVHCDGLIHISNMANHYVANPAEILSLREKVLVKVLDVEIDRKRIALKLMSKI